MFLSFIFTFHLATPELKSFITAPSLTSLPLTVSSGSIKSNLGHLEGSAGLAAIIKSMLILERGVIAPNALFEKLNPEIEARGHHVAVPAECVPWPARGLRRVSVNSFGFGGSNAHVS